MAKKVCLRGEICKFIVLGRPSGAPPSYADTEDKGNVNARQFMCFSMILLNRDRRLSLNGIGFGSEYYSLLMSFQSNNFTTQNTIYAVVLSSAVQQILTSHYISSLSSWTSVQLDETSPIEFKRGDLL